MRSGDGAQTPGARRSADVLENSSELTEQHEIAVDVPAQEVWFDADEGQLRQIVWNLATNGLRAMPAGGRLTLAIASHAVEGGARHVILSVRDEGTGIAPEDIDGIFQPFRGGFSRGTGLGLSIVRRIIERHGGTVSASGEPGRGARFVFRFGPPRAVAVGLPFDALDSTRDAAA